MRWENKVNFDCLLSRQHLCQKLSQLNPGCKDYSKSKVGCDSVVKVRVVNIAVFQVLLLSIEYGIVVLFSPYYCNTQLQYFFWTDSHTVTYFCHDLLD